MCDFDDFDDDDFCDDGDYTDDDFEDPLEVDEDDWDEDCCDENDTTSDGDYDDKGDDDGFTWKEAMFIGGVLGCAYEEWLEDRKKRESLEQKREKQLRQK